MDGSLEHALGFIFGVVFVSALLVIMMLSLTSRNKKLKRSYDERQELVRGKGFKYAFYTVITLNMLYAIAEIAYERIPIESSLVMFLVAICGVGVYAWYCILNDGYFAINEKKKETIICLSAIGIFNIVVGIGSAFHSGFFKDGVLTYNCMNLVCGIFMVLTVAVIFIKQYMDKRED
ncbi:MAG: hypothetical protein IJX12_04340 [Lachnospiraceae bacterium]|nr:hypothetical protein [Lachnospiraceae bacterium]